MAIGAWQGKLFSDNPKYFMLYVLEHTDIKVTWIGDANIKDLLPSHPNLRFARKDSAQAIWALLRAKTWIFCWGLFFDLTDLPIRGRALVINLWHGIPVKYVGRKSFNGRTQSFKGSLLSEMYLKVLHLGGQLSYLATSSDEMTSMLSDGVPTLFNANMVIKSGTPRNDYLINNANNKTLISSLKTKYSELLGFDPRKKIVTYLPTHRNDGQYTFAFFDASENDQLEIKKLLDENNAVLIEKHHYLTLQNFPAIKQSLCTISIPATMQTHVDVQELLLITDVFICDYTSAYLDFALLKRPVIHFAYDYDHYKTNDAGMAFPLEEYGAGPSAISINELISELPKVLSEGGYSPRNKTATLLVYETGTACKQILEFIKK